MNISDLNIQMQNIRQEVSKENNVYKETMELRYIQQKNIEGEDVEVYILYHASSRPASLYRDSKEFTTEQVYNHICFPVTLENIMIDKSMQLLIQNYFSNNSEIFKHIPNELKNEFCKNVKKFLEGEVIKENTGIDDKFIRARSLLKESINKLDKAGFFAKGDGLIHKEPVDTKKPATVDTASQKKIDELLKNMEAMQKKIEEMEATKQANTSDVEDKKAKTKSE